MARKMKDSGIEWIGEIPEGWETCLYKYCCSVQPGYPFDSAKFSNSSTDGFPLIRIRDITSGEIQTYYTGEYPPNYIVTAGDLLVGMDGDFNVRWWNNDASLLNQRCCRVTEKDSVLRRFLYYVLPFTLQRINTLTYATTVKHLANGDILNSFIAFPSLPAQQNIVHYLDTVCSEIDAMLSKTRSSIEEYKKLKQAVITQAVTKGVRGEREIKESKLPWASKIPKAWNTCAIRHIMFECKERTKDGHEEQLSVTQQFGIIKSSDASIANPSLSLDDWRIVAIGDIVFNKYKAHSGVFFVSPFSGIVTFNYSVYRCFPNCYAKYFEYQYKTHGCISEFRTRMHGVGNSISPLYTKDLMKIKVVCPPLDEQKEISNYLDAKCAEIDKLIAKKEQLVIELESYKKSLIYEVVTGKREV